MSLRMILTGDINLLDVTDAALPFRRVGAEFRAADLVFSNLECSLCKRPRGYPAGSEGFFADPRAGGEALKLGGIQAVGIANNVNFGEDAIMASIARLDELGLPHTGAGASLDAARAPVILERDGTKVGFLQRTSVYWMINHEATRESAGVAIVKCHTAYQVPIHRIQKGMPAFNRPGVPPVVLTWPDAEYLKMLVDDIAALRSKVDFLVASFHWGMRGETLQYMRDIAHAAIDAGADVVMGHGPHDWLPVEAYKGKPVFYSLGSFYFLTGHGGLAQTNRMGMMARLTLQGKEIQTVTFQFVGRTQAGEAMLCTLDEQRTALENITKRSDAKLTPQGDQVAIELK